MKFRNIQGSLTWEKIFTAIFEFFGQFFFQNDVFNLQKDFSEHGITVFIENGLESFQKFPISQI
jgi:hypothetical protein